MLKTIPLSSLKSGKLKFKSITRDQAQKNAGDSLTGPLKTTDDVGDFEPGNSKPIGHRPTPSSTAENRSNQDPKVIGAGGAPEAVRRIFECEQLENAAECQLVHEEDTARIYFKVPDRNASKVKGQKVYNVLQCADISAGDLKVTTKFGSWDTMLARILIECDGPMFLWKQKIDEKQTDENHGNCRRIEYEFVILSSCMVKATFPVEFISTVCKMMHLVKVSKTREILTIKDLKRSGVISKQTKMPSKIREGLPEWVNYIPYRWYSANLRRVIEYLLVFYTIVSLLWAVWQLYRHVDFIRSYLKPIVTFIEHYFSMLKSWFQWMDDAFTVLSHYWWNFIKPLFMIVVAALSPLFQIFRPLKGIINIIPHLFDPFIQLFNMICMFVKPVFLPLKSLFGVGFHFIVSGVNSVLVHLMGNPTIAIIIERGKEFYIIQLIHEALHGHLDPLKAQVVVIRDLIFKSSRKIYYGLRFIVNKIYFVIIFLRREREYSKEGQNLERVKQEDETKLKED